jgi:Amt family ammonium transporter
MAAIMTEKQVKTSWKFLLPLVLVAALAVGAMYAQNSGAAPAVTSAPAPTPGAAALKVDTGDTAWVLISTTLVMIMTPGLAFFYGGLVRKKNVLSILMQCFMILCIISLQWALFGYSLAFAGGNKFIGGLSFAGLSGVGAAPYAPYASTIPHELFMVFQMMFAVITPALIIGAFAERMKFSSFCIFTLLWATLVYDPVAHWVWGAGGFMGGTPDPVTGARGWGALDFAGGTVVHINAGVAALAAALVLGKRQGFAKNRISGPHNLPIAVLGAAMLWMGWFGFNAGSALRAGGGDDPGLATNAFVVTHLATAAAGLAWCLLDWLKHGKPTTLGMITGAVAGLVAITPASGFVTPMGAIVIGLGAGLICWLSVTFLKTRMGYDDSLDAFGVHGVGGIFGALATGLFATLAVNSGGGNGLFYGNPIQLWIQFKAVAVTATYSFVVSYILLKAVDKVFGLRVTEQNERVGLDLTEHKEAAYTVVD